MYNFEEKKIEFSSGECAYFNKSLICSGMNKEKKTTKIECEAELKLNGTSFNHFNTFWMSNLKLIETDDQLNFKFDLHPQDENKFSLKDYFQFVDDEKIEIFSVHLSGSLNENGISIKNKYCWYELMIFFLNLKHNNLDTIKNEKNSVKTISKIVLF